MTGRLTLAQLRANARKQKAKEKTDNLLFDPYEKVARSKTIVAGKTGFGDNPFNVLHFCLWDSIHQECPERYSAVIKRLNEEHLIERCVHFTYSKEISLEEIHAVHSPTLYEKLLSTILKNNEERELFSSMFDSVYINMFTPYIAVEAASTCVELVSKIIDGELQNGIAVIRPPGHHAMRDELNGYCFLNNACLAAESALKKNITKILIVDWDVHHGQGIQNHFYKSSQVLYISIHRYENGNFWPNLDESNFNYIGVDNGEGFNINIPLNFKGMTDADYLYIFHNIIMPVAVEFQPELVIISAGYDAALGCPEGEMCLSPAIYYVFTHYLMSLASGKVAVLMEGGYCIESLAEGVLWTLHALLRDSAPSFQSFDRPSLSVQETTFNVYKHLSKYWKCFDVLRKQYDVIVPKLNIKPFEALEGKFPTKNTSAYQTNENKNKCLQKLASLQAENVYRSTQKDVSIVYDPIMSSHKCEQRHVECPERITDIMKFIHEFQLNERVDIIKGDKVKYEQLATVHKEEYLKEIIEIMKGQKVFDYESIYISEGTRISSFTAAGCSIKAVDEVMNNISKCAFAVIRPPGHHAERSAAGGFCFFNNVSVAAKYAINKYHLKRVLIFDFDIHHGNGTQDIFDETNEVLYISIHRYENAKFYPNKTTASHTYTGVGKGEGYSINIPWNSHGMDDADYTAAVLRIVLPIAYSYNPQLVLISAGFDAAVGDPLGKCCVSPEYFAHMVHYMKPLAQSKLILFLEGGYNINSVSHCAIACIKSLLGDPLPTLHFKKPTSTSAKSTIDKVIDIHHKKWPLCTFNEF